VGINGLGVLPEQVAANHLVKQLALRMPLIPVIAWRGATYAAGTGFAPSLG